MDAHAHTPTPRLTPASRQANWGLAEQEKEAARDHTLGGRGSQLSVTLSREAAQKHMDTSIRSEYTGHDQGHGHYHKPSLKEKFWINFSLLCLHYSCRRELDMMLTQ